MHDFFYGPFLVWLPTAVAVIFWLIAFVVCWYYAEARVRLLGYLFFAACIFAFVYGLLLTYLQYHVWLGNPFTRELLRLPLQQEVPLFGVFRLMGFLREVTWGYFAYFVLYHFWLRIVVGLFLTGLWFGLLRLLAWFRPRAISDVEVCMILLGSVLTLWPGSFLFVFLSLLFGVVILFFDSQFLKQKMPGILAAIFLALVVVIVAGHSLLSAVGFGFLYF